jgi:hypothetical protein
MRHLAIMILTALSFQGCLVDMNVNNDHSNVRVKHSVIRF